MSAYFDGGADIAGRRLREVEVIYVHDPTLNLGGDDSDDCPPSPPPTYYLRVREEASRGRNKVKHGAIDTQVTVTLYPTQVWSSCVIVVLTTGFVVGVHVNFPRFLKPSRLQPSSNHRQTYLRACARRENRLL